MLTVKCPQCAAMLKLAQAPASGKVKCPKCAAIVPVGGKTASPAGAAQPTAARRPTPASPSAMVDPNDDNFDFGRINFPSATGVAAVSQFPSSGRQTAYSGPIPGDPLDQVADQPSGAGDAGKSPAAAGGGGGGGGGGGRTSKKGMSTLAMVRMLVGLALLIVCTILAVVVWTQRSKRGDSSADVIAAAQSTAPSGYRAVGIQGCVVLMPQGNDYDNLPSLIECLAMETKESGSIYFLGAMDGGKLPLDKDQMRKKAERQLGGEILGGQETNRNGYPAIKGVLDGSIFLPRMMVEVFHVDERFCILGCAPRSMGADPSAQVDRALEAAEQKIFYGSFKIGPKPGGWW